MRAERVRTLRPSYVALFIATLCLLSIASSGSQQPASNQRVAETGRITGQVAADDGAPVTHVPVQLSGPVPGNGQGVPRTSLQETKTTETDDRGHFEFAQVEAGIYSIGATPATGYVRPVWQQTIRITAGPPTAVKLRLFRTGAISGRILDEAGKPIARARVAALRYEMQPSGRRLVPPAGATAMGSTDDRGQFRLFALPPDDYYVSATASLGPAGGGSVPVRGYAPAFYPGAIDFQQARPITVEPGGEATDISFPLRQVPLGTISGTASDSLGRPIQSKAAVTLVPRSEAQLGGPSSYSAGPDGRFTVDRVPPGEYYLIARMSSKQGREGAFLPVIVRGGFTAVNVQTNAGAMISGSVRLEGDPSRLGTAGATLSGSVRLEGDSPRLGTVGPTQTGVKTKGAVRVTVRSAPAGLDAPPYTFFIPSTQPQVLDVPGPFVLEGLWGALTLEATVDGAALKAVLRGTEDITGMGFALMGTERIEDVTIVMTTETGSVRGIIAGVQDEILQRTQVVVFPDEPGRWFEASPFVHVSRRLPSVLPGLAPSSSTRITGEGSIPGGFLLPQLLPGRYWVIAVEETEPSQTVATDRASLQKLRSRATEAMVTAGQVTVVRLSGVLGRR